MNEKENLKITTALASSVFLFFNLLTLVGTFAYFGLFNFPYLKKSEVLAFGFTLVISNYFLFIHKENYLRPEFQKDRMGGFMIVTYLLLTITLFLIYSFFNRKEILG